MSNKKCKLPEGSFKRAKKGYEENYVPAPKRSLLQMVSLFWYRTCLHEREKLLLFQNSAGSKGSCIP